MIFLGEPELLRIACENRAKRKGRVLIGTLLFMGLIFCTAGYLGAIL
jgi:hypothetical protein